VSPVRIDSNSRVGNVTGRSASGRASGSGTFEVNLGGQATEARAAMGAGPVTSLDALLALQAVDDPLQKRRRMARRGTDLIDTLEGLRTDLLAGRLTEGRLSQLMAVMTQARERGEPGLDALLDEIELRARVELAKRGLYPA